VPTRFKQKNYLKALMKNLNLPHWLSDTIYTVLGILFSGFALQSFLVPNHFLDGGVTGISLLLHEIYHINSAYLIIAINVPFIIMGAYQISRTFAVKTTL
jgi:uncharacterized membrane-anchored protein YitT (DUF2179 family)